MSLVPFWDGEVQDPLAGWRANRFGGDIGHTISNLAVAHTTVPGEVHAGTGAFKISTVAPLNVNQSGFFQLRLTGELSGYVDSRDLGAFTGVSFWVKNATGSAFSLNFEIKDVDDDNAKRVFQTFLVPATGTNWTPLTVNFTSVVGSPDLSRAILAGVSITANQGQPVNGSIYIDDMDLIEAGGLLNPQTASILTLLQRLDYREFRGLWGARDRTTGLLPNISQFPNTSALNSSAALVQLLPGAVGRLWVTQAAADNEVQQVITSLNSILNSARYVPFRYFDRVSLQVTPNGEESPVDAAFMFLALYQYKSLPQTSAGLKASIETLLNRFNFAAFSSPQGWKLAYQYGSQPGFTPGAYGGYTTEIYLISLAAHLATTNHVDIQTHYHSGTDRVSTDRVDPALSHATPARFFAVQGATSTVNRAPFTQWLMSLFVKVDNRGKDTYSLDLSQAANPHANAIRYQREVDAYFASQGRPTSLQPDAGDDGTGLPQNYHQFSAWNNFGDPSLYMPWSDSFVFFADPGSAEGALRAALANDLQGPLGLSDTVRWASGQTAPDLITARHDFWNLSLSALALTQYLYQGNELLASLPEVRAALDQVFSRHAQQNSTNRFDVNDDLLVDINDLLGVLVELRRPTQFVSQSYNDVNGNDQIEINDGLDVIFELRRRHATGGEVGAQDPVLPIPPASPTPPAYANALPLALIDDAWSSNQKKRWR